MGCNLTSLMGDRHPQGNINHKYQILNLIGVGHEGKVVSAISMFSRKPYAIKIVPSSQSFREVDLLRRLDHPNIVHLYDVKEYCSKTYIVMELALGGSLCDRLRLGGVFNEARSRRIMIQLLAALHYLHRKGITHRDVKPENILFRTPDPNSSLFLTDFDLSSNSLFQNKFCGTPYFVAPEMIEGISYSYPVDMWATGVVLFIITIGRYPFVGNSYTELYWNILNANFILPESDLAFHSAQLKSFLEGLLIRCQRSRLSADRALSHPWIRSKKALMR